MARGSKYSTEPARGRGRRGCAAKRGHGGDPFCVTSCTCDPFFFAFPSHLTLGGLASPQAATRAEFVVDGATAGELVH